MELYSTIGNGSKGNLDLPALVPSGEVEHAKLEKRLSSSSSCSCCSSSSSSSSSSFFHSKLCIVSSLYTPQPSHKEF